MWYWAGRPGFPFEGSFAQTGFATSTDGIHWIKYDDPATTEAPYANSDPVLKLGVSPFAWDHDRTIIPVVRSTETGYEMWYTGLCLGITGEHIGYATSDDGISWNKYADNPIFADDQVDWGHVLYGGAVLKYDEYYHLWFANFTTTDWARPQIGYARSKTAGIDWHDKNSQYLMSPNYPNPFSHSTIFEYRIDEPAVVALTIYNHLGQQIESLVNNHQQQGKHQAVWNAEGLPAGIYFYRLQAGEQQATGKMVVLR